MNLGLIYICDQLGAGIGFVLFWFEDSIDQYALVALHIIWDVHVRLAPTEHTIFLP